MKLFVIGCGNMAGAMVKGIQSSGVELFDDIGIVNRSREKVEPLLSEGVSFWNDLESAMDFMDDQTMVMLGVKPQQLDPVFEQLNERIPAGALVLSIVAGVSLARLKESTGHEAVVRVMPNTPTLVGEGVSGWMASESVDNNWRTVVVNMLESFGSAVEVASDDEMDALSMISGCGPAYVFYFLESLIEGGIKLGLSEKQALDLAIETFKGGAELAREATSLIDLKKLRANVTSKGGVTEQAIRVFDEHLLKGTIEMAMKAGYDRSKEL